LYIRIKKLCEKNNISISKLERALEFPRSYLSKWEKSAPSIEKVQMVAKFFDVSIDYIYGNTDNPKENLELTDDERLFLDVYARAKESDREDVQDMLKIIDRMLNKEEQK
jgi:transcriptional regulator with XRE-family HTH domain